MQLHFQPVCKGVKVGYTFIRTLEIIPRVGDLVDLTSVLSEKEYCHLNHICLKNVGNDLIDIGGLTETPIVTKVILHYDEENAFYYYRIEIELED